MPLSGADARHLRALAHKLVPVVQLGKEGITEALAEATARALLDHELIKVKLLAEAPIERREAAEQLAAATESHVAQVVGRVIVLYKPHPKKPKIRLPRGSVAAPAGEGAGEQARPAEKKPRKKSGIGNRPKHKRVTAGRAGFSPKKAGESRRAAAKPRRDRAEAAPGERPREGQRGERPQARVERPREGQRAERPQARGGGRPETEERRAGRRVGRSRG